MPEFISQPEYPELESETTFIPLPVLYKNEQRYNDVVDILKIYEQLFLDICHSIQKDFSFRLLDRLTRERFSGAKVIRAHEVDPNNRFENVKQFENLNFLYADNFFENGVQNLVQQEKCWR